MNAASASNMTIELMRGDLMRVLYEASRRNVRYVFDDSIEAIEHDRDGVQVSFLRAAPARFDLVIGADGVHSGVRRLSFGPEEEFIHSLEGYMAVFTVSNWLELDRWQLVQNMPGRVVSIKTVNGTPKRAPPYSSRRPSWKSTRATFRARNSWSQTRFPMPAG